MDDSMKGNNLHCPLVGLRIGAFGECTTIEKTTVGDDQVLTLTRATNSFIENGLQR
jgi:hypothetical protein